MKTTPAPHPGRGRFLFICRDPRQGNDILISLQSGDVKDLSVYLAIFFKILSSRLPRVEVSGAFLTAL
ncbi:MAG: hypothetical protein JWS10_3199 [Cypionkella sp.]|nr:hypothetical protein [Cypionkella sp.]MDB5666626.1 hypothetical protein [Cypionkella sp.]